MKGDDISDRLIDLSVRVIRVVEALPKTVVGRHVGGQLVRAGTSGGSNYEEARGAESKADFIHKLGISWKEVRESIVLAQGDPTSRTYFTGASGSADR